MARDKFVVAVVVVETEEEVDEATILVVSALTNFFLKEFVQERCLKLAKHDSKVTA